MIYNYSLKNDYYTQVNNKSYPETSCKNTSVIMALNQAGYDVEVKQLELETLAAKIQPEDVLTELAFFRGYRQFAQKHAPWFFDGMKPKVPLNEIPQITVKTVNDLFGNVAKLAEHYNLKYITDKLKDGYGFAALGRIVTPNGKLYKHVVSIAGYETDKSGKVTNVIIDDPYGAYKTNYEYKAGNDVKVPVREFIEYFLTGKWLWLIEIKPEVVK
jgi:hypothetical protein